jgi:hypothetical protein
MRATSRAWKLLLRLSAGTAGGVMFCTLTLLGTTVATLGVIQTMLWMLVSLGVSLIPWNVLDRREREHRLWVNECTLRRRKGLRPKPFHHR